MSIPRLLFAPVTGQRGAGEYFRSLCIAQAVVRRWPAAEVHFIVDRAAGFAQEVPFPTTLIDGSPTRNTPAVIQLLEQWRPHIAIFDSAGRAAQLRAAQRLGIRTVYISSRPKTRWKGFRLRRMLRLDQHWLAWPEALGGGLSRWERLKLAVLRRPEILFFDTVFAPPDEQRAQQVRERLGVGSEPYVLVCGGGGGYARDTPVAEIFRNSASAIARATSTRVVCVMGPNYRGTVLEGDAFIELAGVEPQTMTDLIDGATLAVVNGGSLMLQALALRAATLAAAVAADQQARITLCNSRGAVAQAALDAEDLAARAVQLLQRPAALNDLRAGAAGLNLRDGAAVAVDALSQWL